MAIDLSTLGLRSGQTNDQATRASDMLTQIQALLAQYVSAPDADPSISAMAQQLGQAIQSNMAGGSSEDTSGASVDPNAASAATAPADPSQDPGMGMASGSTDGFGAAREGAKKFLKSKNKTKAAA